MFKHNIYGDQVEVLDGMPDSFDPLTPEFFMNPSPLTPEPTKATTTEAEQSKEIEKAKEPEKGAPIENFA